MNYRAAVKAFYDSGGQLQLGVGASLAAGPYGRAADVSASASSSTYVAATYAYSASKGLYAGYSFEGSRISERPNTNLAYYGRPISAREILTGYVPPPQDAARLYNLLLSLGAGPRPGLVFGPKKSQQPLPPHMATSPYQQQPPIQAQIPVNTSNDEDSYNDPPPPYAAYDRSKPLPPLNNNNINTTNEKQPYSQQDNLQRTSSQYSRVSIHNNTAIAGPSHAPFNETYSIPPPQDEKKPLNGNHSFGPAANQSTNNNVYSQPFDKKQPPLMKDNHHDDAMTVVIAKYDFTANEPSDLSFKAGDAIIVTKRLGNRESWWEGEIGNQRGFFPANYTEDLTD